MTGSHSTFDGYPRECAAACGKAVRITKDSLWFETVNGVKRTYHFACRLRLAATS